MNILALIFSLLLIFSYGFYAIWDKHITGTKLQNTYISYAQANRDILNQYESKVYNSIGAQKKESSNKERSKREKNKKEEVLPEEFNRECARINLWPLVQEGKENHPELYELTAKLIRTFYAPLIKNQKRFEYTFLNLLLACIKKSESEELALEKVDLLDPEMQKTYYKMLKGTKNWNLRKNIGYPPILDYIKLEKSNEKICLFHSHPDMLTALFNEKIAWKLYAEIHQKEGAALTEELIHRIAFEMHTVSIDPDLLKLLNLASYPSHTDKKTAFSANSGEVSLRKNFSTKQ